MSLNKTGADEPPPLSVYDNWLDFWEKKTGRKAVKCEVFLCKRFPDTGGHVMKMGEDNGEYVLPMCYSCSSKPEDEILKVCNDNLVSVKQDAEQAY